MEKDKLIDKLSFYEGFLDSFIERGKFILRENDMQSLRMLREYIIKAKKELKIMENE